jgi:hypothetical protein
MPQLHPLLLADIGVRQLTNKGVAQTAGENGVASKLRTPKFFASRLREILRLTPPPLQRARSLPSSALEDNGAKWVEK